MSLYNLEEFSKITNLTIGTLRYYNNICLLTPEVNDNVTDYVYYSDKNLEEIKFIKLLISMDFSLQEIITLKNNDSIDLLDNKLQEKKRKIVREIEQYNIIKRLKKSLIEEKEKSLNFNSKSLRKKYESK